MYNMLLEISTELDSIKAMLQKSECTHLLEFQIFCKEGNEIAKILLIIQPNFELLLWTKSFTFNWKSFWFWLYAWSNVWLSVLIISLIPYWISCLIISLIIVIVCLIVLFICLIACLFVTLQTRSSPGRNQHSIWTTVLNLLDKWSSRWWWWWWWRWWWWWGWWWWWCSKPKFLLSWTNDGAGSMMLFLWWLEQNNLYLKYSEHGVECGVLPFLSCWWRWKRLTF